MKEKEKEKEEKVEKEEEGDCGMVSLKEKLKRNFCGEVISATTIQQAATKQKKKKKPKKKSHFEISVRKLWNQIYPGFMDLIDICNNLKQKI